MIKTRPCRSLCFPNQLSNTLLFTPFRLSLTYKVHQGLSQTKKQRHSLTTNTLQKQQSAKAK